jgi:ankyrin repeat protein
MDSQLNHGQTALHLAAIHGWARVVAVLLQQPRTDVNVQAADLRTPLHDAAVQGNLEITQLLLADKRCKSRIRDAMGV